MDQQAAEKAIDTYYTDICAMDTDAVTAHWEPDGSFADPVGITFHTGTEAIRAFVAARFAEIDRVAMQVTYRVTCADKGAAHWQAQVTGRNGNRIEFQGITVFTFGEHDQFRMVEEYYDPAAFIGPIVSA